MQFQVHSWLSSYSGSQFTPIVRPRVVGCWSKESATLGGSYQYGSLAGLSEYQVPSLPASLDEGYPDAYIKKDDGESVPVEVIIRALQQSGVDMSDMTVCTFRNNLNKILNTPLSPGDAWAIDACLYRNTLFLDIVKTPQRDFPDSDRFTYYGYKFEALCSANSNMDGGVDATAEFALLLKLKLGQHSICMAAEVDCARPGQAGPLETLPSDTSAFLELKSTKLHPNPGQRERALAQKYPRWWVQSFLAAIPTIVVGARDEGQLTQVFELAVDSLPSAAAAAGKPFDAWQLLQFGDQVLSWMMGHGNAHPEQHLSFEYQPAQRCIACSVRPGGSLPGRLRQAVG